MGEWNLVTSRPKGWSFEKYKEVRREQNLKVRQYRIGVYFWYSNGVREEVKGVGLVWRIAKQGTYVRSNKKEGVVSWLTK